MTQECWSHGKTVVLMPLNYCAVPLVAWGRCGESSQNWTAADLPGVTISKSPSFAAGFVLRSWNRAGIAHGPGDRGGAGAVVVVCRALGEASSSRSSKVLWGQMQRAAEQCRSAPRAEVLWRALARCFWSLQRIAFQLLGSEVELLGLGCSSCVWLERGMVRSDT